MKQSSFVLFVLILIRLCIDPVGLCLGICPGEETSCLILGVFMPQYLGPDVLILGIVELALHKILTSGLHADLCEQQSLQYLRAKFELDILVDTRCSLSFASMACSRLIATECTRSFFPTHGYSACYCNSYIMAMVTEL